MSTSTIGTNNFKPVHTLVSSPVTIVLTGGLLFILLTSFFSFFFYRSFFKKLLTIWNNHQNRNRNLSSNMIQPSTQLENAGLDYKIIQSFPVFPYSMRDCGMDQCSICLTDFMDDDIMRLISTCNHFFHTVCIDLWFKSHKTCPICRFELDVDQTSVEKFSASPEIDLVRPENHNESFVDDILTIIVHEDHPSTTTISSLENIDEIESYERQIRASNFRFWRSYSTGHSIVVQTENEQKEEKEKEEIKIHIEISGECQFEDHKMRLPNRKLYCVRETYSVG